MWQLSQARVGSATHRWQLLSESGAAAPFEAIVSNWAASAAFRAFWVSCLREVPFAGFCWECPPVTSASAARPFECVLVSSPSLARMPPDPEAFGGHFRPGCRAVTFENLGGDAVLVAPCPDRAGGNFAHLAGFTATATPERQDALWEAVGHALQARIGARPLWLSTAGHGVAWLHVRLDSRPKYYRHAAYRRA